jgi:hypothetical protein
VVRVCMACRVRLTIRWVIFQGRIALTTLSCREATRGMAALSASSSLRADCRSNSRRNDCPNLLPNWYIRGYPLHNQSPIRLSPVLVVHPWLSPCCLDRLDPRMLVGSGTSDPHRDLNVKGWFNGVKSIASK